MCYAHSSKRASGVCSPRPQSLCSCTPWPPSWPASLIPVYCLTHLKQQQQQPITLIANVVSQFMCLFIYLFCIPPLEQKLPVLAQRLRSSEWLDRRVMKSFPFGAFSPSGAGPPPVPLSFYHTHKQRESPPEASAQIVLHIQIKTTTTTKQLELGPPLYGDKNRVVLYSRRMRVITVIWK